MENIRYWIFRIPDWQMLLGNREEFTFSFTQKRRFSGTKNDKALILDNDNSGLHFSALFTINEIKKPVLTLNDNDEEVFEHSIGFQFVEKFKDFKPLDYYLYSIKRVRNWDHPIYHFRLKYTEINQLEFEAIVEDKVFLERTILGGVLNELPVEHRESFMELLMAEMPSVFFEINDYTKVFELLKKYLEFAIINPSKMLSKSFSTMKEILPDQNLDDVSFGEVNDNFEVSSMSIVKDQVDVIDSHLPGYLELLEMGSNSKTQEGTLFKSFNDLFKGTNVTQLIKKI